jgi:hypothetical protein
VLKGGRSDRNLDGLSLRPVKMKHWTCILQIYSEMSLIRVPVEIDGALPYLNMFDTQRLP